MIPGMRSASHGMSESIATAQSIGASAFIEREIVALRDPLDAFDAAGTWREMTV